MSKILLALTTIVLSCGLIPAASYAEDLNTETAAPATEAAAPETKSTTESIPKDTWLSQMTPMLPELICKGFVGDEHLKKRFDELKMTYEQCVSYIPDISSKCQKDIYKDIPNMINNESAAKWGRAIGECIGKTYAENYLIPK